MIGKSFSHYEILARVGAGGMGEVFRAQDLRLNREVAIKVIPRELAANSDRLRRFELEAKALAALNHPNIMTVFDVGQHEGQPYLVSELLEGQTLRQLLDNAVQGTLSARKATDYAVQIAQGLSAAHRKGIIHRDLKPGNLFVTKDGRVKILDFGLAKLRESHSNEGIAMPDSLAHGEASTRIAAAAGATTLGWVMGTPNYMSPEQVSGERLDHRADLFTFGCVLYEMVSGQRPFRRDTSIATMAAIMKEEAPNLADSKPDLPPTLTRIIQRCLEKLPQNRFQSAEDLAFALETVAGNNAPSTEGFVERGNVREPIRSEAVDGGQPQSHGATRWASAIALGVLAGGLGGWILLKAVKSPKPLVTPPLPATAAGRITSLAVRPLDDFSGNTNDAYLSDGLTEALCAALGNVSALRVPGRSSVMRYKGGQKSIPEMARELNVEAIVEGSVQRTTTNMLVTVQLIEAATDRHLWATNYKRDLSDFFVVQSEVARAIANEVQARLTPEDQGRLARVHPAKREAIEACLLGKHHFWKVSDTGFSNALIHFQKAIQIDSNHALGYAGAALAYAQGAGWWLWPAREAMPKARLMAQRAIDLDPGLADGYMARGVVRLNFDWDWPGAESDFKQAIQLRPSSSDALDVYAGFLIVRGRTDQAVAILKKALEIDPLSPPLYSDLGWASYNVGNFDQAISLFAQALELDPNFFQAHYWRGWSLTVMGKPAEALPEFQTLLKIDPDSVMARSGLGYTLAINGQRADAMKVIEDLDQLASRRYVSRQPYALTYLGLGQEQTALDCLEKAYEERDPMMPALRVDLGNSSLRHQPRFQALLNKVENGGRNK